MGVPILQFIFHIRTVIWNSPVLWGRPYREYWIWAVWCSSRGNGSLRLFQSNNPRRTLATLQQGAWVWMVTMDQASVARQKALAFVQWVFLFAFASYDKRTSYSCLCTVWFCNFSSSVSGSLPRAREGNSAVNFPGLSAVDLLQSYWHFWWEFYDFFLVSLVHVLFSLEPVLAPLCLSFGSSSDQCLRLWELLQRREFCHHLWRYRKNRWNSIIYAKYYPQISSYLISTAVLA